MQSNNNNDKCVRKIRTNSSSVLDKKQQSNLKWQEGKWLNEIQYDLIIAVIPMRT